MLDGWGLFCVGTWGLYRDMFLSRSGVVIVLAFVQSYFSFSSGRHFGDMVEPRTIELVMHHHTTADDSSKPALLRAFVIDAQRLRSRCVPQEHPNSFPILVLHIAEFT